MKNSTGTRTALEFLIVSGFLLGVGFSGAVCGCSAGGSSVLGLRSCGFLRRAMAIVTKILRSSWRIMSLSSVFDDCGFTRRVNNLYQGVCK